MQPKPTGEVTLLFTDVEGSTRLWERHPDVMATALRRHDDLLRHAIEGHGGYVFKTVGDAFCAAFSDPAAAVAAARDGQRVLASEPWSDQVVIRVRMGLHTGTCSERDGDYFGPTVNRTARLEAIAHGDQIVISSATATRVRDRLDAAVTLVDLGEHRLKDLGRPEWVFQVDETDRPRRFPPLRSLDDPKLRHNLPAQVASFVGRAEELGEIRSLMADSRLVTLTGSGGAGKTRLALQAGADDLDGTGDGVWFVDLGPVTEPSQVPAQTAAAVGVREEQGRPITDTLIDALRSRRPLIILDNCEHLIDACAAFAQRLLESCPRLAILATSREALGIPGERLYRVPSLSLPPEDAAPPGREPAGLAAVDVTGSDAYQLFVDRARQHLPEFDPDPQTVAAVASICRQLDGIPLALELAAASLRRLSARELAERLDSRFRLLTGGSRTAMPRQQTLRAAVDWSFELLGAAERRTFSRLSVFADGWSLAAAEAVCSTDEVDPAEVIDVLGSLVDKSLVQADVVAGTTRYRLLETIRHYAAGQLVASGEKEAAAARAAHARYFLDFAERCGDAATAALDHGGPMSWLSDIDTERSNLRAAIRYDLGESEGGEAALRMSVALRRFWQVRGEVSEGLELLEASQHNAGEDVAPELQARALLVEGDLRQVGGDYAGSLPPLLRGLAIARTTGDRALVIDLLSIVSLASALTRNSAGAADAAREAVELARAVDDPIRLGAALDYRSVAAMGSDPAGARRDVLEALASYRRADARLGPTLALMHLSLIDMAEGNLGDARAHLGEALEFASAIDAEGLLGYLTLNLGIAQHLDGDGAAARASFQRALSGGLRVGNRSNVAHAVLGLALGASADGRSDVAASLHGTAEALLAACGHPWGQLESVLVAEDQARLRSVLGDTRFEERRRLGAAVDAATLVEPPTTAGGTTVRP